MLCGVLAEFAVFSYGLFGLVDPYDKCIDGVFCQYIEEGNSLCKPEYENHPDPLVDCILPEDVLISLENEYEEAHDECYKGD